MVNLNEVRSAWSEVDCFDSFVIKASNEIAPQVKLDSTLINPVSRDSLSVFADYSPDGVYFSDGGATIDTLSGFLVQDEVIEYLNGSLCALMRVELADGCLGS